MGADQSSRRERDYRDFRELEERRSRDVAAAAREVEKKMEQQRKLYEQKINLLVVQKASASTAATQKTTEAAATAKDVEKALEQQRILYEQKIKDLLHENKASASAGATPQTALDRPRSQYAYTNNDLQARASTSSNVLHLYPNLDSGFPTISSGHTTAPSGSGYGEPYNGHREGFVFVNSHFVPHHQSPSMPPNQSFQPSAPPMDTATPNSRSRSRQRNQDADITCRTCGQMYGERIFQCNQGHSSCDVCKTRQVVCGQCRQQITSRRNYDLEKHISERKVKCPNSDDGCRLLIKMADMNIHEKECPFKELACPSLGDFCRWKGKMSQLLDHFDSMHPTHRQADVDQEMVISNISNTSQAMHYIKIGTFNFFVHLKVSETDKMIYMAVQLLGTKHSAAKWTFEFHMYNKSQPRRKFQYIGRCSSTSDTVQDIIENMDCAVISMEYAKTFIYNGGLATKFYIKKDEVNANKFSIKKDEVNTNKFSIKKDEVNTNKFSIKKDEVNANNKKKFVNKYRGRGPRRNLSKDSREN